MNTWYVDSTATGTHVGTSWTNACTSFAQLIAIAPSGLAAGDDINVSDAHGETTAAAITLLFPGTYALPNRIFCCDTTNAPAQSSDLSTGAQVSTTGASAITLEGNFYCYGVSFNAGSAASAANVALGGATTSGAKQIFDNCEITLNNTSTSSRILVGTATIADPAAVDFLNCTLSFGNASQGITGNFGVHRLINSVIAGVVVTTLFLGTSTVWWLVQGVDLSAFGTGKTLVAANCPGTVQLLNCRFNASVTVSTTSTLAAVKTDLINCDSSATGYRCERYRPQGTLTTETTIVRSGGSPQSWKVVTSANGGGPAPTHRYMPFECFENIVQCTAGVAVTVYCDCITDIATGKDPVSLTNADLWIEAQVLDQTGNPMSSLYTTAPANQLTSGTTLTAGPRSGSWTTTGMTTPDPRTQSLTFTPQISGYTRVTVKIGRASLTTLRVDFKLQV